MSVIKRVVPSPIVQNTLLFNYKSATLALADGHMDVLHHVLFLVLEGAIPMFVITPLRFHDILPCTAPCEAAKISDITETRHLRRGAFLYAGGVPKSGVGALIVAMAPM